LLIISVLISFPCLAYASQKSSPRIKGLHLNRSCAEVLLRLLNPLEIVPSKSKKIGDYVYMVQSRSGNKFVVRLRARGNETSREAFASRFASFFSPIILTPPTLLLSREESLSIHDNLSRSLPDYRRPTVWNSHDDSQLVTLTPFYEGLKQGTDLLIEKRVLGRDELEQLASRVNVKLVGSLSPEQKVKRIKKVFKLSFIRQLADAWAVFTILGMPDFHPGNWFYDGKRIFAIDLANHHYSTKTEVDPKGKRVVSEFGPSGLNGRMMHPFGGSELGNDVMREFLLLNVSPDLKKKLSTFTRKELNKVANEAGFKFPEGGDEETQIITRIRYFANLP
jgi:hypothetical protein